MIIRRRVQDRMKKLRGRFGRDVYAGRVCNSGDSRHANVLPDNEKERRGFRSPSQSQN